MKVRRNMRRGLGLVAAASLSSLWLFGCGDGGTGPGASDDGGSPVASPPTAVIDGPTSAYISYDGQAPLPMTSENSEGNISTRQWWVSRPDGTTTSVVLGEAFDYRPEATGTHTVHLAVSEGALSDTVSVEVLVKPAIQHDLPLRPMIVSERESIFDTIQDLVAIIPETGSRKVLFSGRFADAAMDPTQKYLAISTVVISGRKLNHLLDILDLDTQEITTVIDEDGVVGNLSWHPSEPILAFTDDGRVPGNANDELFLASLQDGAWEIHAPGGDQTNPDFYGASTSFSSDGSKVIMGAHSYGSISQARATIYDDLFGIPTFRKLHTEDQLEAFFSLNANRLLNVQYQEENREGALGARFHPDSRYASASLQLGFVPLNRNWIILADTQGEEPIRLVSTISGRQAFSPDGNYIYFNEISIFMKYERDDLLRVHTGGGLRVEKVGKGILYGWY